MTQYDGQENSQEPRIFTVGEVNQFTANLLNKSFPPFWMTGEVGTLTLSRAGHVYMTLKESGSQISTVQFGAVTLYQRMKICQGAKVEVYGRLGLYVPSGTFQFNISQIRLCGTGSLQEQFDALCKKLENEGLFAPERKRMLPLLPLRVGLITSAEGAAVRDFLKIAHQRFPGLDIRIYPSAVQGAEAPAQLIAGVQFFNACGDVDVIVLTRGGGSREDLWCFNDEMLARTIAASRIPTVSAVGHERDFSISDFVADARAATPTAAAELLFPEREAIVNAIETFRRRAKNALELSLSKARYRVDMSNGAAFLAKIHSFVDARRQYIDGKSDEIMQAMKNAISDARVRVQTAMNTIRCCSPESTVKRGFVILTKRTDSKPLCTAEEARAAGDLCAIMSDGSLNLKVDEQ